MDKTRRRLLVLLCGTLYLCIVGAAAIVGFERLSAARSEIESVEARFEELPELPAPVSELREERNRLQERIEAWQQERISGVETSPYVFAARLREQIAALGLSIQHYQSVEPEQTSVDTLYEFALRGDMVDQLRFLQQLSEQDAGYVIPRFELSSAATSGEGSLTIRIGYRMDNE